MQDPISQLILEQLKYVNQRLDAIQADGSERGRRIWQEISDQSEQMAIFGHRLKIVEQNVVTQGNALHEYDNMRQKAVAAGWIGQKLLWIGGGIITFAAWLYSVSDNIISFLKWIIGK